MVTQALRDACFSPISKLKAQIQSLESLAHIAQAENEAIRVFDAAVASIEAFVAAAAAKSQKVTEPASARATLKVVLLHHRRPCPPIKKQRVVKPAALVKTSYLETTEDVDRFISELRQELETAIKNNERIQIR